MPGDESDNASSDASMKSNLSYDPTSNTGVLEPREKHRRTYVVYDATSHMFNTNPVVRLEAYEQTSRERHVQVGPAESLEQKRIMYPHLVGHCHEVLTRT